MFATTFLGHQGWVFQTANTCLLVDPLLCEEFGQAHALEYKVFPPRIFTPEAFPRVDAVILSHEHDDHFDIPSLAQLDRQIPILLSARSSTAAYQILCGMGFSVSPFVPGVPMECGDLQVLPLCGDHMNTNCGDEWDTLPFVVRQSAGAGSFFTMVDCKLTAAHIASARGFVSRPGIVTWTNNTQDWSHMMDFPVPRIPGTADGVADLRATQALCTAQWGPPSAIVTTGGGFAFYGERKWLNRQVFCVDSERVVKAVSAADPSHRYIATRPGQTLYMENNQVTRVEKQAPFLSTTPPNTWPIREKSERKEFPDYAPASGRREPLNEEEFVLLRRRLNEFAASLVGTGMFMNLHSMLETEAEGRMLTFALVLRQGDSAPPLVFMYNASGCSFEPVPVDNPRQSFIAGMECWAVDLLAVLNADRGAIAILFGRAALWNVLPKRFEFAVLSELTLFSHPLRRPADCLRMYESQLQRCPSDPPRILHRST